MTSQVVNSGADTWADEARPGKPHGSQTNLKTQAGTGVRKYIYIWLRCPAIKGDTVASAILRLTAKSAAGSSQTFTARRITDSWKAGKLTWNDGRPDVTGSVTATVASVAAGDVIELDVTAEYQSAANGASFFGVRIETTGTTAQSFYSLDSPNPPSLEVEYYKSPQAPTQLVPAGIVGAAAPVVGGDYTDTTGNSFLTAIQVQADPAASTSAPAFDSGWVSVESPNLDLSTTTFTPLAESGSTQWRMRVQGDSGQPSPWSDWVTITYHAKGAVTITNPSAGAVGSPTFEADATFTATVKFWRIRITSASDRTDVKYDSGKRLGSTISLEIPAHYKGQRVVRDDHDYQINVRAWDDVADRVASPGCPIYSEAWATFTVVDDSSTPPDSVTASTTNAAPMVTLQWHRTTEPDSWVIRRDGVVIATPDMSEVVSVGSGVYQWIDTGSAPQIPHTWTIKAVTDGAQSAAGSSGSVTLTPEGGVWVIAEDGSAYVCIRRSTPTGATNTDQGAGYQTIGSRAPFRIVTALSGRAYLGFRGTLEDGVAGRSLTDWWADALTIKSQPTQSVRLVQGRENLLVQLSNMSITTDSSSTPQRPVAAIGFDYQQVGEFEYGGRV